MVSQSDSKRTLRIWTLPNAVSASRYAMAPVVLTVQQVAVAVGATWTPDPIWMGLVLLGLVLAEVSDVMDGRLARSREEVSDFGKLLDPLCDSVFRMLIYMGFMAAGWMPLWMLVIHFLRDISVAYARIIAGMHDVVLAARISGKIKAIVQGTAQITIVCLFLVNAFGWPEALFGWQVPMEPAAWTLLLISTVVTAWSGFDYVIHVMTGIAGGDDE